MKKPPFPKRNPGNRPPMIEGGGARVKKPPITRKEPENAPDATPFIPKGALMHTQKPLSHDTTHTTRQTINPANPNKQP